MIRAWKQQTPWLIVMFVGATLVGCRPKPPPDAHSQPLASSVPSASGLSSATLAPLAASVAADPTSSVAVSPTARAADERWQHASGEDLADKQALADAVGAAGLLDALDDGGNVAITALLCLPLADDADAALGPLAKRLSEATNESREPYLVALLGIAGRPARAREVTDLEGAIEASDAVLVIAKNDALPREHRALAISILRALAEKKILAPSKIPTDLDPP